MQDGYFDDEGPGEHDAHLLDRGEGENDFVPCPECGTDLLAMAESCYACGATFQSEAWQAAGEGRLGRTLTTLIVVALVGVLLMWMVW